MDATNSRPASGLLSPDVAAIEIFAASVFGYCDGFVAVRAIPESPSCIDTIPHSLFIKSDDELASRLLVQAKWASTAGMALFVVPGTFAANVAATADNVIQMQAALVDLDKGDIGKKRAHLTNLLGPPSFVVESGGVTPEGQRKLHMYWQLSEAVEDVSAVCLLRQEISSKVDGDDAFRSAHQPIRVAGSVHHKGGGRVSKIVEHNLVEYELRDMQEMVASMPPLNNGVHSLLDFNEAATGKVAVAGLFQRKIREGGVDGVSRFDALSRVIGQCIRRTRLGEISKKHAWDIIVSFNKDSIVPPWPHERLKQEAERLWRRDADRNGDFQADLRNAAELNIGVSLSQVTEDALALEFTARHGADWRYVAGWGHWLHWDNSVWRKESTLGALHLARLVCREAAGTSSGEKLAGKISSAATVAAVERLAKSDRRHAATVDEWDTDLWSLNTPGGTVNLHTGVSRAHDRADRMTKLAGATPGGDCPNWKEFLATITDDNAELQSYLQRMIGYSLSGITSEHVMFFLYGGGANGKSVFCNVLATVLGDYCTTAPMDMFMSSNNDRHPTDLAGLRGARLVTATETDQGRHWAEAKLKLLTGGDPVKARLMRQDFFQFVPQFKLCVVGNHKPAIRNVDEAMRRRLHLVPFSVTIPPEKRDKGLTERLLLERDGILAWAIEGCLEWQNSGLKPPQAVMAATDDYFEQEDGIGRWIAEACTRDPNATELTETLFQAWKAWAEEAGEFVGSTKRFSENLVTRGLEKWRHPSDGKRGYRGITLKISD